MQYYQRIRNIREDMDIKQYEFAEMIGVLKKTYNLYENGFRHMPLEVLDRVLIKLNISLDYVLGLSDNKRYENMKNMDIDMIPSNLKKFRIKLGLSQDALAQNIGLNQQTISEYERGKLKVPIDTLNLICKTNKISADLLTGRITNNQLNFQLKK